MTVEAHRETLDFQTEVRQLLHLMVHSLYSNKEIFLRELISNASDACDKLRFEALSDEALYEGDTDLTIEVDIDRDARTLSVTDNGIGMNRQEVIDNIGTIARSGTRQFLERLSGDEARDARLIGQFGVGFYSSFIVADRVTVETRRAGLGPEHGVRWTSDGQGSYTLENIERARRGTTVTLHLREGEDEFLDPMRLRAVIRKYSDHISLPVRMRKAGGDEWETVNRASALWARPRGEIKDEEYVEFYKHLAHDFEPPLAWVHNHVEGTQSYTTLFYLPRHAPFDLYDRDKRYGIKLYVRRVFIMDDAEQLMPAYLRFVRGVVDSDDLPLNISREILQRNRQIDAIRAASVKRVLGLLENLAKDEPDKYATFWKEFGRVLKEGPAEDAANRERIAGLLRFASTVDEDEAQRVTLADYLERMKPEQEHIYYLIGESPAAVRHSPHLEVFRRKGVEVLLLWDRVDEWMMSYLTEYQGKRLVNVAKGELDLGRLEDEQEKRAAAEAQEQHADLIKRLEEAVGDRVKAVRVSHRLTDSPACLVVESTDMGMSLHKLLRQAGHEVPEVRPTLEINPAHPLVQRMAAESDTARFTDWSLLLLDQAMLAEGGQLDDPVGFVRRMNELMLLLGGTGRATDGGGARRRTTSGKKTAGKKAAGKKATGRRRKEDD